MSQHDAVEVISAKRDKGALSDSQIDWVIDAYTRGRRRRRADVGAGDGDPAQRHGPARDRALDGGDDRVGGADGLLVALAADGRQALDRRRRRQDHAAARAAGGRVRGRRTPAERTRPRPHRRHPRQAGVDPRLARGALERRDAGPAGVGRRRDLRRRRRAGARGQEALRAARRDRHGRGDPADRLVDHVQEDRRGHRCAGARREGRDRRVHEGRRLARASSPRRWWRSARTPACTRWRC